MSKPLKIFFGIYFTLFIILFIFASFEWIPPHNYTIRLFGNRHTLLPMSVEHFLGTDRLGNDTYTLIILGIRTAFFSGLVTTLPFILLGTLLGLLAGYGTGKAAFVAEKTIEVLNMIPKLLLLLIIISFMPVNTYVILSIFGAIMSPKLAELLRSRVLTLKSEEFFESAISLGLSRRAILLKHVLWYNARDLLVTQAIYIFNLGIMMEASLSYIGLGFSTNYKPVSWGHMIHEALYVRNGLQIIAPVMALTVTTFLLYLFANQLAKKITMYK